MVSTIVPRILETKNLEKVFNKSFIRAVFIIRRAGRWAVSGVLALTEGAFPVPGDGVFVGIFLTVAQQAGNVHHNEHDEYDGGDDVKSSEAKVGSEYIKMPLEGPERSHIEENQVENKEHDTEFRGAEVAIGQFELTAQVSADIDINAKQQIHRQYHQGQPYMNIR